MFPLLPVISEKSDSCNHYFLHVSEGFQNEDARSTRDWPCLKARGALTIGMLAGPMRVRPCRLAAPSAIGLVLLRTQ